MAAMQCRHVDRYFQSKRYDPGILLNSRTPHMINGQYEFMLPIDENSELVDYEIDKRKACFVNVSFQTDQEDEDSHFSREDEGDLTDFFDSAMNISIANPKSERLLNFDNDSREIETITLPDDDTFEQKRIHFAISECIFGNLHAITQYLSTSTETKVFLHGRNKTENTNLITVAADYRVPHIAKTAAVLDREVQFDPIGAISDWGIDALPPNKKTESYWIKQVFYIAFIIDHAFQDASDPSCDQDIPEQYFASHAEKKLIAYFMNRHVFLSQDKESDQNLKDSILEVEDSLIEGKRSSSAWAKVCDLGDRRAELNLQLFEADDRLLDEYYDEQEVKRLKQEIHAIDEELFRLRPNADVIRMRAQEKKKRMLLKREKTQEDLIKLSSNEPHIALRRAVILSSNKICGDCTMFNQRVNHFFKLSIEMN
ncbi:MAG: hypothetical protein Q9191_000230 [Dirinaria sp. TL-2023a]